MAIENTVSNDYLSLLVDCINVFDCRLLGVVMQVGKKMGFFYFSLYILSLMEILGLGLVTELWAELFIITINVQKGQSPI